MRSSSLCSRRPTRVILWNSSPPYLCYLCGSSPIHGPCHILRRIVRSALSSSPTTSAASDSHDPQGVVVDEEAAHLTKDCDDTVLATPVQPNPQQSPRPNDRFAPPKWHLQPQSQPRRLDPRNGREEGRHQQSILQEYATLPQTPISLQMLLKTGRGELLGKSYLTDHLHTAETLSSSALSSHASNHMAATPRVLLQMASLLRHELPIRLAHRIQDLIHAPHLRDVPSVQTVRRVYQSSFERLIQVPPILTTSHESDFACMLRHLYDQHAGVLVQMAEGAYELRDAVRSGRLHSGSHDASTTSSDSHQYFDDFSQLSECHAFLDRFYLSRIGIRVLVGQYLALREAPRPHYTGLICHRTSPRQIVQQAADIARQMGRERYHGRAPLVQISGRLDLTFPYVPTYLHYILLELLKNAVRATCEAHPSTASRTARLPPIQVVIADGQFQEDVVIKISDEGGGIPRSQVDKIWSYLYTTVDPAIQRSYIAAATGRGGTINNTNTNDPHGQRPQLQDHSASSPIAGLGYGLPISRSYCRYFGGQLDLVSMEGYGTDAFVHLRRVGDADEPLEV